MSQKKLKVLHWNIHQAGGHTGKAIPQIVLDEIAIVKPDIGCLTEYSKSAQNSQDFVKHLEKEYGYNVFCTQGTKGQNDVLIFIDKKYTSSLVTELVCNNSNEAPNYLEVLVEGEDFRLTVVGTRIRVLCNGKIPEDRKFRLAQMERLNTCLKEITTPAIIALGDFNGREKWLSQNLTAADFCVCKSNGNTYNFDNSSVVIDHAVVKGIKATVNSSWSFVTKLPEIYKKGQFSSNVPSPYPDHAQLICDIAICEQQRK